MQNIALEPLPRQNADRNNGDRKYPQPAAVHASQMPKRRGWVGPVALVFALVICGLGLGWWKIREAKFAGAAAVNQPEPMETVTVAVARAQEHRRTTTSIGTIVATRSITLQNELPGTVKEIFLTPGEIVEAGTVLVALDVSVEEAELKAQEAEAALAETLLERMERAVCTGPLRKWKWIVPGRNGMWRLPK